MDYSNINETALRSAIEGVEDNNRINGAQWSDWQGADDVGEVYGIDFGTGDTRELIQRAIDTNGASLTKDLPVVGRVVWGQNFQGSFWDR